MEIIQENNILLMGRKIITEKGFNPLEPNKWEAYRENWDFGEPIGVGKTEEEAITDLLEEEELRSI